MVGSSDNAQSDGIVLPQFPISRGQISSDSCEYDLVGDACGHERSAVCRGGRCIVKPVDCLVSEPGQCDVYICNVGSGEIPRPRLGTRSTRCSIRPKGVRSAAFDPLGEHACGGWALLPRAPIVSPIASRAMSTGTCEGKIELRKLGFFSLAVGHAPANQTLVHVSRY